MTEKIYTAFVGSWDDGKPDWTCFRVEGLSWENARQKILEALSGFDNDHCEYCREDAQKEKERLTGMEPGPFNGEVDGDDYLIIEEPPRA